jgi:hypothetical protein
MGRREDELLMTEARTTATGGRLQAAGADDRRTARIVGVLFLVALVPYLIGGALYGPSLESANFLEQAYPERQGVAAGLLIEFLAVLAIPLIGAFLYPVLRRVHEALALAYALLRLAEALLLMTVEAKLWSLIGLSDDHLNVPGAESGQLQALGDANRYEADQLFLLYIVVFAVAALIFYGLLIRSRLLPRWLSTWGFASAGWMLVGTLLITVDALPGASEAALEAVFVLPLPLNEVALASWLIIKGFDRSPTTEAR